MIITNYLYQARPNESEGFRTAARSAVVRTESLAEIARSINLGSYLRMSKGEAMGGGRENPSLLENTVEALIGAIFKDGGLERASDFITRFIVPQAQRVLSKNELKDAKSLYQEKIQKKKRKKKTPPNTKTNHTTKNKHPPLPITFFHPQTKKKNFPAKFIDH